MDRPNIVIFNPDQMRRDALHHMGNGAAVTPNLDRFAEHDAVSFRRAFCQNTVCVPSRCSFLTGLYPHVHGHRTMSHMLHSHETSLFRELKEAGYYVWLNNRNDFLPAQEPDFYDRHADFVFRSSIFDQPAARTSRERGAYGDKDYYSFHRGKVLAPEGEPYRTPDEACVDAAVSFLAGRKAGDRQPFCLFLGLSAPHPPYLVEEPYFSAIDRGKLPPRVPAAAPGAAMPAALEAIRSGQMTQAYSERDWDELRACYLGMCMKVDFLFGRLCGALRQAGLYDSTDLYVFSDHGDFTGDYGITEKCQNTFQDCLTNVPFLVKPHKGVPVDPGVSDSLVELVDFYATAMDLSGVTPDHTQFGRSLRDVLADRSRAVRDCACCEGGRLAEETHCTEVVNGAPPLDYEYRPRMMAQLDPVCHTKATMLRTSRYKYVRRLYEADELYDLEEDPSETVNRIDDPALRGTVAELRLRMLDWYQGTCDVVPFREDSRFSPSEILELLQKKGSLTPQEAGELGERLRRGELTTPDLLQLVCRP